MSVNGAEVKRRGWVHLRGLQRVFRQAGIVWPFLLIVVVASILIPSFLSIQNVSNISRQVSAVGIAALGATFVIISAGIDLSVGAIMVLVGMTMAVLQNLTVPINVPLCLAMGALCGLANGFLVAVAQVPPFVATFGTSGIAAGLSFLVSGGLRISLHVPAYHFLGNGTVAGVPMAVIIYLVAIVVSGFILGFTTLGSNLYATGGNQQSAYLSGINVTRVKVLAYVLAGVFASLGGLVLASRLTIANPGQGSTLTLDVIAAVVLGGTRLEGGYGSIPRTVLGTLIIGVLNNVMILLNWPIEYQMILKGFIIITAVWAGRTRR